MGFAEARVILWRMEHPSARDRQRKNASIRFADGLVRYVLLAREKNQNDYTVPLYESFCWSFFQKATSLVRRVDCYSFLLNKSEFGCESFSRFAEYDLQRRGARDII